jgi:hypothetical protein
MHPRERSQNQLSLGHTRSSLMSAMLAGWRIYLVAVALGFLALAIGSAVCGGRDGCAVRIVNVDGLFSAHIARNIYEGRGLRSSYISLFEVNFYSAKGWLDNGPPWPTANRFPGSALMRVPGVALFGSALAQLPFFSALSYFATLILVTRIALKITEDSRIALLAAAIYGMNTVSIFTALQGKEVPLEGGLYLGTVYALARALGDGSRGYRNIVILGILVGAQILIRYNIGLPLLFAVAVVIALGAPLRSPAFLLRRLIGYALPIAVMTAPMVTYNIANFSDPLVSTNVPLQLIAYDDFSSNINTWWKLSYDMPADKVTSIRLRDRTWMLERWKRFVWKQWQYFLRVGLPELGFSPWFWWLAGYGILFGLTDSRLRLYLVACCILSALVLVPQVLLVPLFAGTPEYTWFLYPTVALLAAVGFFRLVTRLSGQEGSATDSRPMRISAAATLFVTAGTAFSLWEGFASSNVLRQVSGVRSTLLLSGFMLVLIGVVALKWERFVKYMLVGILLVFVAVQPVLTFRGPLAEEAKKLVPEWFTDPNRVEAIAGHVGPNGIVLALQPWNVAWRARRFSLPLPEYPDEIALLLRDYGLDSKVEGVYLWGITDRAVADIGPALGLNAYWRAWKYRTPLEGFTVVEDPSLGDGVFMVRDKAVSSDRLMQTRDIIVGVPGYVGHFVSGWSGPEQLEGRLALWAAVPRKGTQLGYWVPRTILVSSGAGRDRRSPDARNSGATLTFNVDRVTPVRVTAGIWCLPENQVVQVVLNSNLRYSGEAGTIVATVPVTEPRAWVDVTFTIPGAFIRRGVNRLDLVFSRFASAVHHSGNEERYCAVSYVKFRHN